MGSKLSTWQGLPKTTGCEGHPSQFLELKLTLPKFIVVVYVREIVPKQLALFKDRQCLNVYGVACPHGSGLTGGRALMASRLG